jgi:hypothetical protein
LLFISLDIESAFTVSSDIEKMASAAMHVFLRRAAGFPFS